jgi:hypothetical protein
MVQNSSTDPSAERNEDLIDPRPVDEGLQVCSMKIRWLMKEMLDWITGIKQPTHDE